MKKILYISAAIDPKRIEEVIKNRISKKSNALEPIAKYTNLVIDGLIENKEIESITSLIGAPISKGDYSYKEFVGSIREEGNKTYIMPGFKNIKIIKHMTIILKFIKNIIKWNKNNDGEKYIIVDGAYFSGIVAIKIANMFSKTPVLYTILDVYGYMEKIDDEDKTTTKIFRKIYQKIKKDTKGYILITEQTNNLVNTTNKPYVVIEGIVPKEDKINEETYLHGKNFIYAGGVHEKYGLKTLVDAFAKIETNYRLEIYGLGDMVEYIKDLSKKNEKIVYKGSIRNTELLEIEKKAFCLINPRPTTEEYTKYSFPSKIMEYLLSARPVLATELPGIPEEYFKYLYKIEDETEEGMRKAIKEMIEANEEDLIERGKKSRKFVMSEKNNIKQADKINELLNKIRSVYEKG